MVDQETLADCVPAAVKTMAGGTGTEALSLRTQWRVTVPGPFTVIFAVAVKPPQPPVLVNVTPVTAKAGATVFVGVAVLADCTLIST